MADLIKDAYLYVHDGVEYAGVFHHGDGKCWYAYNSRLTGQKVVQIKEDPDSAMKEVEGAYLNGLVLPRRTSRV